MAEQTIDISFGTPGADGVIHQVAVVPTGPESGVYFGGEFKHIGGQYIPSLARFDGAKWHQVGDGSPCKVNAIVVDPDPHAPAVFVAGRSHTSGATVVAEYRNRQWRIIAGAVVGMHEQVHTMTLYPVNGANNVVIGGSFSEVRTEPANKPARDVAMGVASWNGKSWSSLGQGLQGRVQLDGFGGFGGTTRTGPHAVHSLLSTIEAGRSVLYAGGDFTQSGTKSLGGIARWDGSAWRSDDGIEGRVRSLCMYDDGSGRVLYAGGALHLPRDYRKTAAVWRRIDGKWQTVGEGLQETGDQPLISRLATLSFCGTSRLLALGSFNTGDTNLRNVAVWNGKRWEIPDWIPRYKSESGLIGLTSVVSYQDALYLGGYFSGIGTAPAEKIARIGNSSLPRPQTRLAQIVPNESSANVGDLKYRVFEVAPAGRWSSLDLRVAALSNTGRVAAAIPTKIRVPQEVASPLFDDNPFAKPRWGLSNDPHLMRDRILLWGKENPEKSVTLPGDEPKYAWKNVCLSPNGKHLIGIEIRTLGSRSAYRWNGTQWQPVRGQKNQELVIFGVNDGCTMVGTSDVPGVKNGREAVVIRDGRLQVLPSPTRSAIALAVSNSGLIAGQAVDKFGTAQACLWKENTPILLGTLTGKWSIAHGVNDSGTVVGMSRTAKDEEAAFAWQNGQMRPIMDSSQARSIAYGINKAGIVVGLAYGSKSYGFIASGDQVVNLNDLLLTDSGWTVKSAIAVNDNNWVLAIAEIQSKEFLVVLVPQ